MSWLEAKQDIKESFIFFIALWGLGIIALIAVPLFLLERCNCGLKRVFLFIRKGLDKATGALCAWANI